MLKAMKNGIFHGDGGKSARVAFFDNLLGKAPIYFQSMRFQGLYCWLADRAFCTKLVQSSRFSLIVPAAGVCESDQCCDCS